MSDPRGFLARRVRPVTLPRWEPDVEDDSILHFVITDECRRPDGDRCTACCGDHLHKGDISDEAWSDLTDRLVWEPAS